MIECRNEWLALAWRAASLPLFAGKVQAVFPGMAKPVERISQRAVKHIREAFDFKSISDAIGRANVIAVEQGRTKSLQDNQ